MAGLLSAEGRQIHEPRRGRDVGDVGHPQPVRAVGVEATLDEVRRRACLRVATRGAWRPVGPAAAPVNLTYTCAQRLVGVLSCRALAVAPRVVPARGDTEHRASSRSERNFGRHRGDSEAVSDRRRRRFQIERRANRSASNRVMPTSLNARSSSRANRWRSRCAATTNNASSKSRLVARLSRASDLGATTISASDEWDGSIEENS